MAKVYNTRNFRANLKKIFDEIEEGKEVIVTNRQRAFSVKCIRESIRSDE